MAGYSSSSVIMVVTVVTSLFLPSLGTLKIRRPGSMQFTFELPDNDRACFYHRFLESKDYVLEYMVTKGGKLDVDALVTSPNGMILYNQHKQKKGQFKFESSPGTYEICFSNEFSTITHKFVYFELRPQEFDTLAGEAGIEKPYAPTQLEDSMEKIHRVSTMVVSYQTDYRLNEAKGRYIADDLHRRVEWWSLGQACIIIFTSLTQVFVLRTLFTDKRTGGLSTHPTTPGSVSLGVPTNKV